MWDNMQYLPFGVWVTLLKIIISRARDGEMSQSKKNACRTSLRTWVWIPCKSWTQGWPCNLSIGGGAGGDRWMHEVSWPASLAESLSSRLNERAGLQNQSREWLRKTLGAYLWPPRPHTRVHMPLHEHINATHTQFTSGMIQQEDLQLMLISWSQTFQLPELQAGTFYSL